MNIEIGKSYNVFNDGKISKSRLYQVKVTEIVPFNEIDDNTLNQQIGSIGLGIKDKITSKVRIIKGSKIIFELNNKNSINNKITINNTTKK